MNRVRNSITCLVLVAGGLSGCGREDSPSPGFHAPVPVRDLVGLPDTEPAEGRVPFKITAMPGRLDIVPGTIAKIDLLIRRDPGFDDAIHVTASGLPAGLEASDLVVQGDATQAELEIVAPAEAPRSTSSALIHAVAAGSTITLNLDLRVLGRPVHGPRGQFDESFGTNGTIFFEAYEIGDVVELPDGRLLVASSHRGICRLNTDGSLDKSFGSNGCAASPDPEAHLGGLALVNDGVIASGSKGNWQSSDLVLAKFSLDGSVDESFGAGGSIVHDVFPTERSLAVIAGTNDRILLLGRAGLNPDNSSGCVLQLHPDGTRDASFGTDGLVLLSRDSDGFPLGLAQTAAGALFLGTGLGIRKYQPNGAIDPSFGGGDGAIQLHYGGVFALAPTEDIVFKVWGIGLIKLSASGTEAQEFDDIEVGGRFVYTTALTVDHDAHVYFAGHIGASDDDAYASSPVMARRSLEGVVDEGLGDNGMVQWPFKGDLHAVKVLADGRILARGIAYGTGPDYDPYVPHRSFLSILWN